MADKQYGLILPKSKVAASNVKKPVANVFGDDSSEDEETKAFVSGGTDWMKRKIATGSSVNAKSGATGLGTKITTKHVLMKQKALEEDPTVFQYDEVFDKMEADKIEQSGKKKVVDRKPKYITNLLKQAEVRNQEEDRRKERKVQKEREAEGEEFADKEKFVTSAYRKKMEEMQKLDEEEQKRQAMEEMLDVTKQKDMSGFYRHLYRQANGEEKGQKSTEVEKEPSEVEKVEEKSEKIKSQKAKPSQRSYRQRRDSEPMEENSDNENKSGDSSSEGSSEDEKTQETTKEVTEEDRMEKERLRREELRKQKEKRERRKKRIAEGRDTSSEEESGSENENEVENNSNDRIHDEKSKQIKGSNDKENNVPPKAKKAKIDIWKKVTVGHILDSALERYLMRKSERGSRFPW